MIVSIGSDLVAIDRVAALWQRRGDAFLSRVFTAAERSYCLGLAAPAPSFAARFGAKEAVMKCLGTGWTAGVRFVDIEVVRTASGGVSIRLHGEAAVCAAARQIERFHLTLSHDGGHALAVAIAEG